MTVILVCVDEYIMRAFWLFLPQSWTARDGSGTCRMLAWAKQIVHLLPRLGRHDGVWAQLSLCSIPLLPIILHRACPLDSSPQALPSISFVSTRISDSWSQASAWVLSFRADYVLHPVWLYLLCFFGVLQSSHLLRHRAWSRLLFQPRWIGCSFAGPDWSSPTQQLLPPYPCLWSLWLCLLPFHLHCAYCTRWVWARVSSCLAKRKLGEPGTAMLEILLDARASELPMLSDSASLLGFCRSSAAH